MADDLPSAAAGEATEPAPPLSRIAARMLARGRREWEQHQFPEAERSLSNVLTLAPGNQDALRLLGAVTQAMRRHGDAVGYFEQALAAAPDDFGLHVNLGISLYEAGDADGAIAHFQRACELQPASAAAWFDLGRTFARQARSGEAVRALRRALELQPAHLSARLALARALTNLGDVDAAVAAYRDALHVDPKNADAWFGLSNIGGFRLDADDDRRLRDALADSAQPAQVRELLLFAAAKADEQRGDYAAAFARFQQASELRQRRVPWDPEVAHQFIEAIHAAFADLAPTPARAPRGREAIFIASFPRSGSTLVEQILASHPEVEGANEIRVLPQLIDAENQRRGVAFPDWVGTTTGGDWERLGQAYLERTSRWRRGRPRCTDKSLRTWPLIGAALMMLPAARVIVVRRDPVETCLGCFRQSFSETSGFPNTLADTARYYGDFVRLMRLWLQRHPAQVFDLEYEALVADPEATIRKLLDFCGLPFDPACLEFHKTRRTVMSLPSALQVRQPIRRDTARSQRYGATLDPLRGYLRAAGLPV